MSNDAFAPLTLLGPAGYMWWNQPPKPVEMPYTQESIEMRCTDKTAEEWAVMRICDAAVGIHVDTTQ
jgi:hypothetical protein